MCGFAGALSIEPQPGADATLRATVERMGATLVHRGPDDGGSWTDPAAGIGLAHRRLSIIDLSREGHQPMLSACGRWVLAYNGEIYNFGELRRELTAAGHAFRGHSDTEVLLEAIAKWGVEPALRRSSGMFALAAWDRREGRLHLARDRVGKKPLYYGWAGDDFIFASELKAFHQHPKFRGVIDRSALTLFMRFCYVPAPYSIYADAGKLRQGSILSVSAAELARVRGELQLASRTTSFWSPVDALSGQLDLPADDSDTAWVDRLDQLLRDAVVSRLVADVPVGAFLSGGIDSSLIVALMQAASERPVRTFTVGFHSGNNEAEHAKAVARHLGTEHSEIYLSGEDSLAVVHQLPEIYDEPFADTSQIPTYLICKQAREQVTVALSGDGGDELFFGYGRYKRNHRTWPLLARVPHPLRRGLAACLRGFDRTASRESRLQKLAAELASRTPHELYRARLSRWKHPAALVIDGSEGPIPFDQAVEFDVADHDRRMMLVDLQSYLTDDILVKVDRASMAVSLEVRAPLLDARVVEFAGRMPMALKFRQGRSKWILRRLLERYVPPALTERRKMGFGPPIHDWLRGPLREWSEALLDPRRLEQEGNFQSAIVSRMWRENLAGTHSWHYHLWCVLIFQQWLERNAASVSATPCACPARNVSVSAGPVDGGSA